jgi:pilus assembly protein CpaB
MKSKTMILMVVAVVCGLVASYLTSRMLGQQPDEKVTVLVAKVKIPQGTKLSAPEELFEPKEFAKGTEPKKAFTRFDDLKDKRVNKTIGLEVHVTPDDLMTGEEKLEYKVPPGFRAVSIKVSSDTNVAGFVQPSSHVDIISTHSGAKGPVSGIILQNVLVLAVDGTDRMEGDTKSRPSNTVTLQVKPEEATKLAAAQQKGELRLMIRPPDDNAVVNVRPSEGSDGAGSGGVLDGGTDGSGGENVAVKGPTGDPIPDLKGGTHPADPVTPTPVVKEVPKHVMTIVNGDAPQRVVFLLPEKGEPTLDKGQSETAPERAPADKPEKSSPKPEGDPKKDDKSIEGSPRPGK